MLWEGQKSLCVCLCLCCHCTLQAAAFAKAQIRTIGNAIKKLSSELYTKDVHFIMELVQVSQGSCSILLGTPTCYSGPLFLGLSPGEA